MNNRTKAAIIGSITDTIKIYNHRGFDVSFMHGDGEFEIDDLKDVISPTEAVIYGRNEHVPIVERFIRTIKERCRTTYKAAPYTMYTSLMVQHLVESRVSWLNRFPSKNGVSDSLSPASIVLGHSKPDMSIKRIPFGSYALVYTQTSNDMKSRSVPSIALSEANEKGGHFFMSLYTGQKIHGFGWEELPIHDDVISRVEELAEDEKQPRLLNRVPLFEWAPGYKITDEEDENVNPINEETEEPDVNTIEEIENDTDAELENEPELDDDNAVNHEHDEQENDPLEEEEFLSNTEQEQDVDVRPRRSNAGAGVERFEPRFGEKSYKISRKRQYMQFKRKRKQYN